MNLNKLDDFIKGWVVGNFEPSLIKTNEVEIAVKKYKKYDCELSHYHKIATEYTIVVTGKIKMNDTIYSSGDIITILPNESTNFYALEDSINVVIKYPGANNDKYN